MKSAVEATAMAVLVGWATAAAGAQGGGSSSGSGSAPSPMQVCYGAYALCAAAACIEIPQASEGKSVAADQALCECVVGNGANLGSSSCDDRAAGADDGYLLSTYSFGLVATHPAMTCSAGRYTNCFGAPCLVDGKDSSRALCTCSIEANERNQPFVTQGGRCDATTCATTLWSSATPAQNALANEMLASELGLNRAPSNQCPGSR